VQLAAPTAVRHRSPDHWRGQLKQISVMRDGVIVLISVYYKRKWRLQINQFFKFFFQIFLFLFFCDSILEKFTSWFSNESFFSSLL
jgi:hypothetical protein